MDPAQHPLTVLQSSWHPLNSKTKQTNARARAPSAQKGLLACTSGSSNRDISDCTTVSSSRDRPANTSQDNNHDQDSNIETTRRTKQSSRSKTHPAGGQTTSPPTKQDPQLRPRHALVESAERLRTPSAEQSPAQRSSVASKWTHMHPRERPPSTNSKDEERPEWPTAG